MSDTHNIKPMQVHSRDGKERFAIVASRFNDSIVEPLINGAIEALTDNEVPETHIKLVRVPGAFELPWIANQLAKRNSYHAIIALGAVIRGETPHFEFVASECARGLMRVSLSTGVPVAFGVLTVDTMEQAMARAAARPDSSSAANKLKADGRQQGGQQVPQSCGAGKSNKGYEAALAALEMAGLMRHLSGDYRTRRRV